MRIPCICVLSTITFITSLSTNTFQGDNETIWTSTSDFQIQQPTSYGTIKLGANMRMQFDFIWHGRTSTQQQWEQFFRVGFDATISQGCEGQSSRYPSLWLKGESDMLHVSVSDDTTCNKKYDLPGIINIGQLYNIIIEYNQTQIDIYKDNQLVVSSNRIGTQSNYIGDTLDIWIPSNKYSGSYIPGNATLSNIILTSSIFTVAPTSQPTIDPTKPTIHPTMIPSVYPTNNPTISPTKSTINPTMIPSFYPTSNPSYNPSFNPTSIPSLNPTTDSRVNTPFDPTTSINDTIIEYMATIPAVVITTTTAYIITMTESKEDIQHQQQGNNNVSGWDIEVIALITIVIMFICCFSGIVLFVLVQKKLFKQVKETKLETIKQIKDANNVHQRNRIRIATESYRSNSDKKSMDILDNDRNNDEEEEDPESNSIQSDLSIISELEKALNINNNDLDEDLDIFDGPTPSGMQMAVNNMVNHEMAEGFAVDYDEKENESIISELEMVEYDDRNIDEFEVKSVNIVQMEGMTKNDMDRKKRKRKKKKKHYKKQHRNRHIKDENNVYHE